MRSVSALLAVAALAGCAKNVKPTGPVLSPYERARDFAKPGVSGAVYSSQPPLTEAVLPPFLGFGATFDLNVVLGLKKDAVDLIEVARVQTPEGPLWVAIETDAATGSQTLITAQQDLATWLPELPVQRKAGALQVQDRTTSDGLDLLVRYTNADNRPVELVLQGQPPTKAARKRNGNTLGHGANQALAVLDVSSAESLFKAEILVDDQRVRTRKVGGIVPFQVTTTQAMGGIAAGEYTVETTGTIPFEKHADLKKPYAWQPPAPPPAPEPFPEPLNIPGDEGPVLLPLDQWTPVPAAAAKAAVDAQTAKVDACLVAAQSTHPDFAGLVQVDFHVKATDAWTITAHPDSTAPNLVIRCVQQIVDGWTFDAKLDGALRVTLAKFPADHAPTNDLEKAWLAANPAAVKPAAAAKPADPAPADQLPDGDLLGEDDTVLAAAAAPSKYAPLGLFDTIHRLPGGDQVAQGWRVRRDGDRVFATQDAGPRALVYEYLVNGHALELRSVQVDTYGQALPAMAITFTPPLPDLRIPFSGRVNSRFVIDVGGQANHATGTAESSFVDSGARVVITPSAPSWAEGQVITSTVNYGDGKAVVRTRVGN